MSADPKFSTTLPRVSSLKEKSLLANTSNVGDDKATMPAGKPSIIRSITIATNRLYEGIGRRPHVSSRHGPQQQSSLQPKENVDPTVSSSSDQPSTSSFSASAHPKPERSFSAPTRRPDSMPIYRRPSSAASYTSSTSPFPTNLPPARPNYNFIPCPNPNLAFPKSTAPLPGRLHSQRFYGRHFSTGMLANNLSSHRLPPVLESYHLRDPDDLPASLNSLLSMPRPYSTPLAMGEGAATDTTSLAPTVSTQTSQLSLRQSSIRSLRNVRLHVNGPDVAGFTKVPAEVQVGTVVITAELPTDALSSALGSHDIDNNNNEDDEVARSTDILADMQAPRMSSVPHDQLDGAFDAPLPVDTAPQISPLMPGHRTSSWSSQPLTPFHTDPTKAAIIVRKRRPRTEDSDYVTRGGSPTQILCVGSSEDSSAMGTGEWRKEEEEEGVHGEGEGRGWQKKGRDGFVLGLGGRWAWSSDWKDRVRERLERVRCWVGFRFGVAW